MAVPATQPTPDNPQQPTKSARSSGFRDRAGVRFCVKLILVRPMKLLAILALTAPAADLTAAQGLDADGARSASARIPVVMLYSATWCSWCNAVKQEFFQHMPDDPAYRDRIILREVTIDSQSVMVDFDGRSVTHGRGRQLAAEMVGVATLDYYGWYLDRRIAESLEKLRSPETDRG